jgi:preprotein translocase subunit SecG
MNLLAIVHYLAWVLFFLSSILLIVVVLLQESKGGGLAEAFGGVGAETFGVKSGGINKFTFTLAGVFIASAIVLHATWNA